MIRRFSGHIAHFSPSGRKYWLLGSVFLLTSCGGNDSANPSTSNPPAAVNNRPTISGAPDTTITQDQLYSFTPSASDADGDPLSFSIENEPTWANFDIGSGSLTGTPTVTDIGATIGVTISVSDGKSTASMAPFDIEVLAIRFGSATVSWDAPTTNADGSPLLDLARFRVHYGTAPRSYSSFVDTVDASSTNMTINNLQSGSWYFSVTAIDLADNESALSDEVTKEIVP